MQAQTSHVVVTLVADFLFGRGETDQIRAGQITAEAREESEIQKPASHDWSIKRFNR